MLIVVVVAEEARRNVVLFEHWRERRDVRIRTLPAENGTKWRMMRHYKPVIRFLMFVEIFLEPLHLPFPIDTSFPLRRRGVLDIAIEDGEVCIAPVKRIVRDGIVKSACRVCWGGLE